jgi:hypothetical protein
MLVFASSACCCVITPLLTSASNAGELWCNKGIDDLQWINLLRLRDIRNGLSALQLNQQILP